MPRRLLLLSFVLLVGCGKRGDAADNAQAADPPGGAVARLAPGGAPMAQGETARALPTGLALYAGAAVTSAIVTPPAEGTARGATTLSFTSADPPAKVAAFYREAAARAGYVLDAEVDAEGLAMLSGRRPDGTDFSLTLTPEGKGASGTLTGGMTAPAAKQP